MANLVVRATEFVNEDRWFYKIFSDGTKDGPVEYAPSIGSFVSQAEAEQEASGMLTRLLTRLEKMIEYVELEQKDAPVNGPRVDG